MPLFLVDLSYDDAPWSEDETDGVEIASRQQARVEAVQLAASIAKDVAWEHRKIAVRVREPGRSEPLLTVKLSVELEPPD